jgi:hypothetical protein
MAYLDYGHRGCGIVHSIDEAIGAAKNPISVATGELLATLRSRLVAKL